MIDQACCGQDPTAVPGTFRRLCHLGKWFAPGAVLLLIPKCPLCIVAYAAMFGGIGLSVSAASDLRIFLIGASLAILTYLAVRTLLKARCGN